MIPDATAAVRRFLLADNDLASLVASRVYGAELDDDVAETMPIACVVLADAGGAALGPGARSYIKLSNSRVDVRCYGETPLKAKAVYSAMHSALKNLERINVDGCVLYSVVTEGGPLSLREPDVDWPLVFGTYVVMASELGV